MIGERSKIMKGEVKETAAAKRITCVDQGGLCFPV